MHLHVMATHEWGDVCALLTYIQLYVPGKFDSQSGVALAIYVQEHLTNFILNLGKANHPHCQ